MMLHQKPSGRSARLKYLLAVPLCGGLLCVSTLGFTKNYGWVDIAPRLAHQANSSGRQATQAVNDTPKIVLDVKPSKKLSMNVKPIPQKDVQHTETRIDFARPKHLPRTSKGYEYVETGYIINGKGDMRVIIKEKDKDEKVFWRSGASDAVKKMLNDKYGYTFPSKMPPPPPAPPKIVADKVDPVKIAFPPPPAKPADKIAPHKMPPPPPPVKPADKIDVKTPPPPPPVKPADKINVKMAPTTPKAEALPGV